MAEAYGRRPSEIAGIENEWAAFQLDEMCLSVGRKVERNLHEGKDALDGLGIIETVKRGYRSLKGFVKKKMKIPENGIW